MNVERGLLAALELCVQQTSQKHRRCSCMHQATNEFAAKSRSAAPPQLCLTGRAFTHHPSVTARSIVECSACDQAGSLKRVSATHSDLVCWACPFKAALDHGSGQCHACNARVTEATLLRLWDATLSLQVSHCSSPACPCSHPSMSCTRQSMIYGPHGANSQGTCAELRACHESIIPQACTALGDGPLTMVRTGLVRQNREHDITSTQVA
jgi:hypothetical protein